MNIKRQRKTWSVYALLDPRDGAVRYIGISTKVYARLVNHHSNRFENRERYQWMKELEGLGLEPVISILETIPHCQHYEATIAESEWIKRYWSRGTLLNKVYRKQSLPSPKDGGIPMQWRGIKIPAPKEHDLKLQNV